MTSQTSFQWQIEDLLVWDVIGLRFYDKSINLLRFATHHISHLTSHTPWHPFGMFGSVRSDVSSGICNRGCVRIRSLLTLPNIPKGCQGVWDVFAFSVLDVILTDKSINLLRFHPCSIHHLWWCQTIRICYPDIPNIPSVNKSKICQSEIQGHWEC